MKVYDKVKLMLEQSSIYRNSDKALIWDYWVSESPSLKVFGVLSRDDFLELTSPETIRRSRQKVQQNHPHLRSSKDVQALKDIKEATKGNFIFHEQ